MTAKKTRKKEKYIYEKILPSGAHVLKIEIRLEGQTFRKNVQVKEFKTPAEAMKAAKRIRDQKLSEFNLSSYTGNLISVKDLYEKSYELFPVALATRYRHDLYYKNVLKPVEDKPIQSFRTADIQESVNKYAETHSKYETGKMISGSWRRLYKTAAALDLDVPDRTVGVVVSGGIQTRHHKKNIEEEDLERFLEALLSYNAGSVAGSYFCQAVYYALRFQQFCGLRPAESFALTRSDIDLKKMTVRINKSIRSSKDELVTVGRTKTEQSDRMVPISRAFLPYVKDCLKWSKGEEYLFTDYDGNLLERKAVNDLIIHVIEKKCPDIDFHMYMLRHNFSTDLHRSGVSSPVIRDLMGHESGSMSLDYAVSYPEDRQKAVNNIKKKRKK